MYSLNVPVPPAVDRVAEDLRPRLLAFESVRERRSMVCKRFGPGAVGPPTGSPPPRERVVAELRQELRPVLADVEPFEVTITGIDHFAEAITDPSPVVYLSVESPGLRAVHARLCERFGAIEEFEGDDYSPHVTLARGGTIDDAERLAELSVEPVTWTVDELQLYDPKYLERAASISLPPRR